MEPVDKETKLVACPLCTAQALPGLGLTHSPALSTVVGYGQMVTGGWGTGCQAAEEHWEGATGLHPAQRLEAGGLSLSSEWTTRMTLEATGHVLATGC